MEKRSEKNKVQIQATVFPSKEIVLSQLTKDLLCKEALKCGDLYNCEAEMIINKEK